MYTSSKKTYDKKSKLLNQPYCYKYSAILLNCELKQMKLISTVF